VPFDKKRLVPINYTSRDFSSIKDDLLGYTKRYYPDNFKDFSEASFGSLMLDTVAYVGDILSFYLDYQVNESFLDTANEYNNVVKLSRQLGYRKSGIPVSSGPVTLYVVIPANVSGEEEASTPDYSYAPILRRGTKFSTTSGTTFTLAEDVNFNSVNVQSIVATVDSISGAPLSYALKTYGQVISGELEIQTIDVGEFERFPRFQLDGSNIVEVVSIFDTQGNQYYEVDYLTQDTVYVPVRNNSVDLTTQVLNTEPLFSLKPLPVPRRFITETSRDGFFIQFGFGSESNITNEVISDPSKVAMQLHGRDYVSDKSFDPTNLISGDKLGVSPSNTTLSVVYRINGPNNVNIASKSLVNVSEQVFDFNEINTLIDSKVSNVINSLEFENENPIVGSTREDSSEEIKYKAYGMFTSQNRAVTQQDYISLIYNMPAKFGSVKRASIVQDLNSFKRNLNIYVISEDQLGNFANSSETIKNNLKVWLSNNKMINDTLDILDAKIVNLGLNFSIIADTNFNSYDVLNSALSQLKFYFLNAKMNIGEPIRYGDILRVLNNVQGLLDVVNLEIVKKTGSAYSTSIFNIDQMTTADGRSIIAPSDVVFEFKYPDTDIVGTIK
jgi:hypothetical protein